MSLPRRPSVYDQLRPRLDAADILRRLGLAIVRQLGSEAYCRPLCHESTSGESLQINLHTGRWNCKACQHSGVSGDLIQLVEYALTGGRAPSRGEAQGASPTHREAVLWLCQQYGVAFDERHVHQDAALDVVHLFAMAAHRHLLTQQDVLVWVQERWGFDRATVEAYGLGFMPSPLLPTIAAEAQTLSSRDAFRSSGLGWYAADGRWRTRFEGRVTFPYLEHGRAVYLIGRATPWTPPMDSGAQAPKYHKLSVHSDTRPYISERISNDHLYNEPVMTTADAVVVAEGVADAVALSSLGVPVVSPVTISFNATDLERFTRKARESNVSRVEVLFDNELSGSGNWAARRVARQLVERGLVAKVLTLPLGAEQAAARDEVVQALGEELFAELERSDPRERKELIARSVHDDAQRAWVLQQIETSKIDAAEWTAQLGPGAAHRFDAIRRAGRDLIDLELEDVLRAGEVAPDDDPSIRLSHFGELINLVAHVEDQLARAGYAGRIARAAGKGITKAEVARRIAHARKVLVKPARAKEDAAAKAALPESTLSLTLLPPESTHAPAQPPPSLPKPGSNGATSPPPPPGQRTEPKSDHERYAPVRDNVARGVEEKLPIENIGEYIAQTIILSMGYTPFRTPDELFLVRGSERIPTGLDRSTARFESLLFLASGLTSKKSSHRAYIAAVVYFLERASKRVDDVSWSHVDPTGAVHFPTGDADGSILKIEPGRVTRTKMAEVKVPAVAGGEFDPITYVAEDGGIQRVLDVFRWTSISPSDRLVLVYWLACLPILRRVGVVPIVRIEGGSSSGKTRTVEAVSYLVNGRKGSSVPTAAALVSRMSMEMLTVDDNRETGDVTPAFLGTLLQATHLGAREKRKVNSDTGTVIERVCGALLMNGIEPIHDGRSELANRMLTLRCHQQLRAYDSPTSEHALRKAVVAHRDAFWSEAVRRCAIALSLDEEYGEQVGQQVEEVFGETRIGRLSSYLRLMYLAWVAGLPRDAQADAIDELAAEWRLAFEALAKGALESLLQEELAVTCLHYAFAWGAASATSQGASGFAAPERHAFGGKYVEDVASGERYLGPVRATQLARLVREAGKQLNAPPAVATRLRAGQLEQRLLDGIGFLQHAGFEVTIETTVGGDRRWLFRRRAVAPPPSPTAGGWDTWTAP